MDLRVAREYVAGNRLDGATVDLFCVVDARESCGAEKPLYVEAPGPGNVAETLLDACIHLEIHALESESLSATSFCSQLRLEFQQQLEILSKPVFICINS